MNSAVIYKGKEYIPRCECNHKWKIDRALYKEKALAYGEKEGALFGHCEKCHRDRWILVDVDFKEILEAKFSNRIPDRDTRRVKVGSKNKKNTPMTHAKPEVISYWFSSFGEQKPIGIVYIRNQYDERAYIGTGSGTDQTEDEIKILEWGAKFPVDIAKKMMRIQDTEGIVEA